jgi:hypothetical protein
MAAHFPGFQHLDMRGLMPHRTRHLFIRQQTAVINAIRAHLAEFGIVAPVGRKGVGNCSALLPTETTNECPMSCVHVFPHWALNARPQGSDFSILHDGPIRCELPQGAISHFLRRRRAPTADPAQAAAQRRQFANRRGRRRSADRSESRSGLIADCDDLVVE